MSKIIPINGQLVGQMWETDHLILFEIMAKLNEVIAAVNDLQPSDVPSQDNGHSEAQS